jgi:poly(A) polymerase
MSDKRLEPLMQSKAAQKIIAVLSAQGFETRFVGGCVRDALLDRAIGDIDLATTALPEQMIACLKAQEIKTIPTGIDHGTITTLVDREPFEITTLRKDVDTDGRHATVAFTDDWQEDALRRDLTINALSADQNGNIFDYYGGLKDIEQKSLRFIGDAAQRIHEDYLRILRFFRFASVLDWETGDKATLEICAALAPHLKSLSRERVQSELYKTLLGKGCLRVVDIMIQHRILSALIDETNFERLQRTIELEDQRHEKDAFRRVLALAGWQETAQLEKFIVLSRDNKKRIDDLSKINTDWKLAKLLYFFGQQAIKDFYFLMETNWDYKVIENWESPIFPLKAEDVFHLTNGPGPEVGRLMKQAENHWADHDFKPSKQDLLDLENRRV